MIPPMALHPVRWLFAIFLLALVVPIQVASAQDADLAAGKAERTYKDLQTKVEKLKTDLLSVAIKDEDLEAKREQLEQLRTRLLPHRMKSSSR